MIEHCNFKYIETVSVSKDSELKANINLCRLQLRDTTYIKLSRCVGEDNCILYQIYKRLS